MSVLDVEWWVCGLGMMMGEGIFLTTSKPAMPKLNWEGKKASGKLQQFKAQYFSASPGG